MFLHCEYISAIEPPNNRCRRCVIALKVFCALQLAIMVTSIVMELYSNATFSVILIGVLFIGWRQLQDTVLMVYMYCTVLLYIISLISVLRTLQNGVNICVSTSVCKLFITHVVFFVYYVVSSAVGFIVYREFKGIAYDKDPQLAIFFEQGRQAAPEVSVNTQDLGNFAPMYGDHGAKQNVIHPCQPHATILSKEEQIANT